MFFPDCSDFNSANQNVKAACFESVSNADKANGLEGTAWCSHSNSCTSHSHGRPWFLQALGQSSLSQRRCGTGSQGQTLSRKGKQAWVRELDVLCKMPPSLPQPGSKTGERERKLGKGVSANQN